MGMYSPAEIDTFVRQEVDARNIAKCAADHPDWTSDEVLFCEIIRAVLLSQAVRAKLPPDVPDGLLYDGSAEELALRCVAAAHRFIRTE